MIEFKENKIKDKNKALRKLENLKLDTNRKIGRAFKDLWAQLGNIGLNFLNVIPKLGKVIFEFFGDMFTDLFHGIYKQQIEPQKAKKVIISIASVAVVGTIAYSGINYFSDSELVKKPIEKQEVKKPIVEKEKKPKVKKEVKKTETKKIRYQKRSKKIKRKAKI